MSTNLRMHWASLLGLFAGLTACYPTTTRPAFLPVPAAPTFEIDLPVAQATRALALALDSDSFPVRRTEPKDGWLESEWFDLATGKSTTLRPLGPGIVKVRAWISLSHPSNRSDTTHSSITIETVYRPLADPSRADRELEVQVPANSVILARIVTLTTRLVKQFNGVATDSVAPAPGVKKP